MSAIQVQVRLFGAFRKYATDELIVELPRGSRVGALRRRLADELRRRCPTFVDEALLDVSVLADAHRVLADGDVVDGGAGRVSLAVLPPVCGG
jgi:molybdopterin converting factor small subunit